MTKNQLMKILAMLARDYPNLRNEILELYESVQNDQSPQIDTRKLQIYFRQHRQLATLFRDYIERESDSPKNKDAAKYNHNRVYQIHKPFSQEIRQRLQLAELDEHYRNWANTIKSIPDTTLPIPDADKAFVVNARKMWKERVIGNEDILQIALQHCVEYCKTGKTAPILLVGEPGIGKTLIAKTYGAMLQLPTSFLSAPTAAANRGLAGAPNLYVGAGAGAILQSMIDKKAGNPLVILDEIDKTQVRTDRSEGFQDQLLSALDESNCEFYDNYAEIKVDASHIPYFFTANDESMIPAPLIDRMDVIYIEQPTVDMLYNIIKTFTLPETLRTFNTDFIHFEEQELEMLVNRLWEKGNRSCRIYKRAVQQLVSFAYTESIEREAAVFVTEKDVNKAVDRLENKQQRRPVGFQV